jgi:hypothetical protein
MTNEDDKKDQDVLDARMEYSHLLTTYLSLANMFWIGYGAFFTVNTLLATGLGLSYSESAKLINKIFLTSLQFLIPMTGIFISLVAFYTGIEISKFQKIIVKRGIELEKRLYARIFTEFHPHHRKFPLGTTIGSFLFFLIWFGALCAAAATVYCPGPR